MGIVNVTPDSFSDGGENLLLDNAIASALRMVESGVDILDIGGESTRPTSEPVSLSDEIDRVIPVIEALVPLVKIPISIDSYKGEVARRALLSGASIINDISAGTFSPEMPAIAAEYEAGVILMHIKGTPGTMQQNPQYDDVLSEIRQFLQSAVTRFRSAGVGLENIIVDPGIGFGKNLNHNLTLIRNLNYFKDLAAGVLYGPSRKSFIGLLTGRPINLRLAGSVAAAVSGVMYGADIVRVHDVAETIDALKVIEAIRVVDEVNRPGV